MTDPSPEVETRGLRRLFEGPTGHYKPYYVDSWAAVIGINNYQHLSRPLGYAVADADSMATLLVTRLGFLPENVFVVLDPPPQRESLPYPLYTGSATKATLEQLLLTDLPARAKADDRVLIFFAGHGQRRKLADGAMKGYLMPADARPGQWHEWVDIESVLDSNLYEAKHVFYLLDACYSGLAATRAPAATSRFEQDLLTRRARQVLTAGKDDQVVADSGGTGHSIFTHSVLEGLGDSLAAQPGSEVVTGFDLMRYVTRRVATDTRSLQTPDEGTRLGHKGGDFIFRLPDSALADLAAHERMKLGAALYELGLHLDSRGRFRSALAQFNAALNQPGLDRAGIRAAWVWAGKCRMQLRKYREAVEAFARANDALSGGLPADALLAQAVGQARSNEDGPAIQTLDSFLERFPEHPWAGWARAFRQALGARQPGRRRALLIGNGIYGPKLPHVDLRQVEKNVQALRSFLEADCGFEAADVRVLMDAEATRAGVINELTRLAESASPDDVVLIYRRGHGAELKHKGEAESTEETVSVCYDFSWDGEGQIPARELHDLINRIPASEKIVIMDEDHCALNEFARRDGSYTLYQSSGRNQGVSIIPYEGAFSFALMGQLKAQGGFLATHGALFEKTRAVLGFVNKVNLAGTATPDFVGDAGGRFVHHDFERWQCLIVWELAESTYARRLHPDALVRLFADLSELRWRRALTPAFYNIADALLEKGAYDDGLRVADYLVAKLESEEERGLLLPLRAYLLKRKYTLLAFRAERLHGAAAVGEKTRDRLNELLQILEEPEATPMDGDRHARIEDVVEGLCAPDFSEAIAVLEKAIARRSERFGDDYPEGQLNLGLFYGACRRYQDAVERLSIYAEPAATRWMTKDRVQASEWLRDIWTYMGWWLPNLRGGSDLFLALDRLNRAYRLDYDDPVLTFRFGQALRKLVNTNLMPTARTNLAWYLLDGALLGFEEEVRQFVTQQAESGPDFSVRGAS